MISLKQKLYFFIILIFFLGKLQGDNTYLHSLFDSEWEYYLQQNPVYATSIGVKGSEGNWKDLSLETFEARKNHSLHLLSKLDKLVTEELSKEDRLNYRLFRRLTVEQITLDKYKLHLLPFSHRGGVQLAHEAVERLPFSSVQDYQNWLNRLNSLDQRIEQTIILAKEGLRRGYTSPKVLMNRVLRQIKLQTDEEITTHPFFQIFRELPEDFSPKEKEQIQLKAKKIIIDKIIPAYKKLEIFFIEEYLPESRITIGIYDLPKGRELYMELVKSFTTTDLSPLEVHQIGIREVSRIRERMEEIIKEVNFKGEFIDFLTFLRTDERFYYDTPEELFEGYLAVTKRIDPKLVKLFKTLPRTPYGIKPIPKESAPDTTTAYYMPPDPGGFRAGYYYVNLYKPETRPKYEMEVLSVHEAVPGHHLQISLALEKKDLPMFRRISPYTVFVEGWGLYSESLGYDIGLYKDPYSEFGQLTYDMWRAVRLVVDTGMHFFEWDRKKAINYFKNNAGKSELDIINEIDRYINWPGQALAYKIGQLKLLELRTKAQKELGNKFNIREFHDVILEQGALPLNEVERTVIEYISDNK